MKHIRRDVLVFAIVAGRNSLNSRAFVGVSNSRANCLSTTSNTRPRLNVARVPDSVVEQFSTEALLDQILDESLRFSARRPIIMEVRLYQLKS
jgi:hypothetical protein